MKKNAISEIIKVLMLKKGIKTTQLAREINVPQQTLQRIVSGVSPHPHTSTLEPIAEYFGITVKQLKGEEQLPESFLPSIGFAKSIQQRIIEIPLLTWNEIRNFENTSQENGKNTIAVSSDINKNSFGIVMHDSSMDPYFPKDSILIIDPEKNFKDRSFVIVHLNENDIYIFRQVLIDGQYKYLKPLNPDLNIFKMRLLEQDDKIIGTLIEARRVYEDL